MIELSWCRMPQAQPLLCDYAQGDQWLHSLCQADRTPRNVHPSALEAIEQTMAPIALSSEQRISIARLSEGAAVVVSGQQVGFLGGPLYTWLKIAGTIEQARRHGAVPVFWIEDNDHDIDEARRIGLIGADDQLFWLECPLADPIVRQMTVASCRLGAAVEETLTALRENYAGQPFIDETIAVTRECYVPGRSWSDAFVQWLQWCWAPTGVLFVRSSILREHGAMQHLIERVLSDREQFFRGMATQTAELEQHGYAAQLEVHNLPVFYHHRGRRYRIHMQEDRSYRAFRWSFSHQELQSMVRTHPECFSPSAALRPLVQDWLLSPIASVLGPAELSYHLQLRRVYAAWGIPRAELVLRPSATVVPSRVMRLLTRHVDIVELFFAPERDFTAWLAQMLDAATLLEHAANVQRTVSHAMEQLRQRADAYEPTLARSVASTEHVIGKRLGALDRKIRRAIQRRNREFIERYRSARVHLFPNEGLQERTIAPIHWLCALGIDRWRAIVQRIATFENVAHYIALPDELLSISGTPVAHP